MWSVVLKGSYHESVWCQDIGITRWTRNPGAHRLITHDGQHRVDDVKPGTWSLVVRGPRIPEGWGFTEEQVPVEDNANT